MARVLYPVCTGSPELEDWSSSTPLTAPATSQEKHEGEGAFLVNIAMKYMDGICYNLNVKGSEGMSNDLGSAVFAK